MRETLPRRTLLAYGSLGLPLAVLGLPSYIFLPTFLAQDNGLSLAVVGTLFLLARVWDIITDPLIGRLSDRLPMAGRRKKVVIAGMPLLAGALWLLFRPAEPLDTITAGALLFAFYLGWTFLAIPTYAWGAELSPDYDQRSRVTAYREGMILAGTLLALILPVLIANTDGASAAAHSLSVLAVTAVCLLGVTGLAASVLVSDTVRGATTPNQSFAAQWRVLKDNKGFWPLLRAYFCNGFANGLPGILFLLFAQHYLQLPDEEAKLLLVWYFVAGIVSIPFWLWLSRRLDKHRAWQISMAVACIFFIMVPFIETGDDTAFLIITLGTGLCVGADLILPSSMQADVIEADQRLSGQARAGIFFAWWGIATKLALAAGSGAFIILDIAGFEAEGSNDDTALTTLVVLYAVVPVCCKLLAMTQIYRFPLTRKTMSQS